jgi:membrane protease YdiL (CAAX protease family)
MNRSETYDPTWSKVGAPLAARAVATHTAAERQYSLFKILAIWGSVTAPMALLAFVVAPAVAPHLAIHRGLVHWLFIVAGMTWQCVVSLFVLRQELGGLRWQAIKERIWLNGPRSPRDGRPRRKLWLWVFPAILANLAGGFLAIQLDASWSNLTGLSEPWFANPEVLNDRQFEGQWWILGLALTSMLFNYILGEELLFRGVLLPRMAGVFGRWDWVANAVLFGLYHVHKIWFWPSMITTSFGLTWAARRYRSFLMGVIVHGVEGFFIVLVFAVLIGWSS